MHDQSVLCAFHTLLLEVQTNVGYMRQMCNNNLEIGIAGQQFFCKLFISLFPDLRNLQSESDVCHSPFPLDKSKWP